MTIYRRTAGVLAETLDGRAAIVNPEGTELITLNEVGSVVWEALDSEHELAALALAVETACENVNPGTVREDVERFLDELVTLGLVAKK